MILGLIPARGGSKGVPRKNLRRIGGITLVGLAIKCAFQSMVLDRVVLSTEVSEIAMEGALYGAEVTERPRELAQDGTPMLSVVTHALREHPEAKIVVLLQPTSPLRTPDHIRRALTLLRDDFTEPTSVVSVVETVHPDWVYELDMRGLIEHPARASRRQDLPPAFVRDGTVYAFYAKNVAEYGDIYGPRALPLVIHRAHSVNIDSEEDFEEAERRLKLA